jgi:hypothetical protein
VRRIRLETAKGELVTDGECIPPFIRQPDVVVWGFRHFAYAGGTIGAGKDVLVYREVFAYHITGMEKDLAPGEKT